MISSNEFPPDSRPLFDTVIRTAGCNTTGKTMYRVDLIGRYLDGPDVPQFIGSSDVFTNLDATLDWARGAIEAFNKGAE